MVIDPSNQYPEMQNRLIISALLLISLGTDNQLNKLSEMAG